MSVTVGTTYFIFELWEQGSGKGVENPLNGDKFVYKHRVVVRRVVNKGEEEPDKTKTSFSHYGSVWGYQRGKRYLDKEDLISALYHWFNNGYYGGYDFGEFVRELGYTDCEKAYITWLSCKKTLKNIKNLGIREVEIPQIMSDLQSLMDEKRGETHDITE